MKKTITFLFLCLVFQAQTQTIDIKPCALFKESMKNGNIDTLDYYLSMDESKLARKDRINLMTFKGAAIIKKNKKRFDHGDSPQSSLIDSSYQLFTDALDMVDDEKLKIGYKFRRYKTLEAYNPKYPTLDSDKNELVANGYKDDDFGFEIQLATKYDNDFWIGAEASLIGGLQSPYHLKDGYGSTIKKFTMGRSMSLLSLSYLRNISESASETKLSLLKVEAPFLINFTQVGFVSQNDETYWFYRPEIGVGYGRFSLSYGINIFFKSESKDVLSRHCLNFRTKYVF